MIEQAFSAFIDVLLASGDAVMTILLLASGMAYFIWRNHQLRAERDDAQDKHDEMQKELRHQQGDTLEEQDRHIEVIEELLDARYPDPQQRSQRQRQSVFPRSGRRSNAQAPHE